MYYFNGENISNINIKWENVWLDVRCEKSFEFE